MPVRKVEGGYKWGASGKVFPTREGAERQARAAYSAGYKGETSMAKKKGSRGGGGKKRG